MFSLLHWLFPETCSLCGERAEHNLCPACMARLERVPRPVCLYCGAPVAGDQSDPYRCSECSGAPRSFDFARSALTVNETTLALIHDFKYRRAPYLARPFAELLREQWEQTPRLTECSDWALIPVPVTARKLRLRGYNQAEELARALARLWSPALPVIEALERRDTGIASQTRLNAGSRRLNARMAYRAKKEYAVGRKTLPPQLVLVDDVYTTGSTARACAAALKALPGVQCVAVLTLLRVAH